MSLAKQILGMCESSHEYSDAVYMDAVNRGDEEEAQRIVDEKALASGYDKDPVFHGTPTANFNVFKRFSNNFCGGFGFWFGSTDGVAKVFAKQRFSGIKPGVLRVYIVKDGLKEYEGWGSFVQACRDTGKSDVRDMHKSLRNKLIRKGYRGVKIVGSDTDSGGIRDDFSLFYPNLIKLADPITRDDKGNVIPLYRRFDPSSDDMRY